jgi:hypothetical protein
MKHFRRKTASSLMGLAVLMASMSLLAVAQASDATKPSNQDHASGTATTTKSRKATSPQKGAADPTTAPKATPPQASRSSLSTPSDAGMSAPPGWVPQNTPANPKKAPAAQKTATPGIKPHPKATKPANTAPKS